MERDWETIRKILIAVENAPYGVDVDLYNFKGSDLQNVSYQTLLLYEAGLIEAWMSNEMGDPTKPQEFLINRLTWSGHEFLDAIKNDTVWNQTKKTLISKGVEATFDIVKAVAIGVTTEMLKPR